MINQCFQLADEAATVDLGRQLSVAADMACVIYLEGDLGAGKTTFTRGFVQAKGHQGYVKSPTYTLVEPYELANWQINHFDLYRLADPEELEFIGIREYFNSQSQSLVEWSERGKGFIPEADVIVTLNYQGLARQATLSANTEVGQQILNQMGLNNA